MSIRAICLQALSSIHITTATILTPTTPYSKTYARGERTQLLAQSLANTLSSAPQALSAFVFSPMLSMMSFFSRHWKKASRASQHLALCERSGAIGAPSVEIFGAGGAEEAKKPMLSRACTDDGVSWRVVRENYAPRRTVSCRVTDYPSHSIYLLTIDVTTQRRMTIELSCVSCVFNHFEMPSPTS